MDNNSKANLYDVLQNVDIFSSAKYMHDFNFISANIGKLLPELSFSDHLKIAKDSAYHQILSVADERNYDLIRRTKRPDVDFENKIIVTFHYSSYRLLNSLLIAWAVPFKVVADDNYITTQGDKTVESYHTIASELNVTHHDFEIINAENRTVLLKCMDAVANGYTLVFYADGNSGVGGMTKDSGNMVKIPFLRSSIYVRKGIPVLANMLKLPVTTVTVQHDPATDAIDFSITENICFPADRKNDLEVKDCLVAIYRNLEDRLYARPGCWEGWFYYHNFMDFEEPAALENEQPQDHTLFNHRFYGIGVLIDRVHYIMNKKNLTLIPISKEVFDTLLEIIKNNTITSDQPVLKSLYTEGILNRLPALSSVG